MKLGSLKTRYESFIQRSHIINQFKHRGDTGFTIIEVMIVLAIAAVILLIVLLAVPALQRNSRNTGRNQDVGQLTAAINNCLSNNNGVVASCQSIGTSAVDLDKTRLNQLDPTTPATNVSNPAAGTNPGSTTAAVWAFGETCSATNDWASGASSRQFAVRYKIETSGGSSSQRCVSS